MTVLGKTVQSVSLALFALLSPVGAAVLAAAVLALAVFVVSSPERSRSATWIIHGRDPTDDDRRQRKKRRRGQ